MSDIGKRLITTSLIFLLTVRIKSVWVGYTTITLSLFSFAVFIQLLLLILYILTYYTLKDNNRRMYVIIILGSCFVGNLFGSLTSLAVCNLVGNIIVEKMLLKRVV